MKRVATMMAVCASWVGLLSAVCAQEPSVGQQLAEFRSRIDALERENAELRQALIAPEQPRLALVAPQLPAPTADAPSSGAVSSALPPSEAWPPCDGPGEPCEPAGHVVGSDLDMSASWHDGLELATQQRDFRVHVGGRTQFDVGWFAPDTNVEDNINEPYENGVDFRRARLRVDGTMYGFIEWAAEYDFVNAVRVDGADHTAPAPTDLWVIFNDTAIGDVRIGNQKPAIGFEHLVSSRFLPFMERSYNQDSFYGGGYNGFWPGVSVFETYGDDDDGTWNIGAFKPTNNAFAASAHDGDYAAVARLTRLLWYTDEGASLLHVGGSAMAQSTVGGRTIFRTRDAIRTGLSPSWPVPASTGTIAGDDMQWLNGELAAVDGPFTFQAEYLASYLTDAAPVVAGVVQPSVGDVLYHGGYVQMFYFLTGEHDNYDKLLGVFTRVKPNENFFIARDECGHTTGGGIGAWQIGARYNYLDLNDNGLDGGILHNGTLGLNWFLNSNMKFQFDFMATHRDAPLAGDLGDGWVYGWGSRWAMDF